MAKYEISRVVINKAKKKLGFDEPVLPKIKKMLLHSDVGNVNKQTEFRTFEDYEFIIYNSVVCDIKKKVAVKHFSHPAQFKCEDCKDTRQVYVFEDCPSCQDEYAKTGMGYADCQWCFGEGGVKKLIPCQTCSGKARKFF